MAAGDEPSALVQAMLIWTNVDYLALYNEVLHRVSAFKAFFAVDKSHWKFMGSQILMARDPAGDSFCYLSAHKMEYVSTTKCQADFGFQL
eukprot:2409137-Amphidinium_carterae.1